MKDGEGDEDGLAAPRRRVAAGRVIVLASIVAVCGDVVMWFFGGLTRPDRRNQLGEGRWFIRLGRRRRRFGG